jgi:hypothetical protein
VPLGQETHVAPPVPQIAFVFPGLQVLLPTPPQQPFGQLVGVQTH